MPSRFYGKLSTFVSAVIVATVLFVATGMASAEEYRTWTSVGGRHTVEAKLLRFDKENGTVELQRQDSGKTVRVPLRQLCREDIAFLTTKSNKQTGKRPKQQQDAENTPLFVKVLVICHDPRVPSEGDKRLSEVFRWNNPRELAELCRTEIQKYSHGRVRLEFVEWIDVDAVPARTDGKTYSMKQYVKNRRTGSGWHETDGQMDYYQVMTKFDVAEKINAGGVDEVWCLGDHFFGIWEASMMGPDAFFINGGVYPTIKTDIPFAVMGGNYERDVDCMLENLLHRTENHMTRAYGGWDIGNPRTNWDRFTANIEQSPLTPAVGTCHFSPNSESDYDWHNTRIVQSTADDWLNYPNLTGKSKPINCEAWRDTGWHQWWLMHLPKASGVNPDGRQNNWWKYIYDHNNYEAKTGAPKPIRASCNSSCLRFDREKNRLLVRVAYMSPKFIDAESVRTGQAYADWNDVRSKAVLVKTSDRRDNTRIVAEYAIPLPNDATFQGKMTLGIGKNQIRDLDDKFVPDGELTSFDFEIEGNNVFRNAPLDLNAMIREGEVKVQAYDADMGNLHDLLNLDADMLMRSRKINPVVIQFEFSKPTTMTGLRFIHSHAAGGRFRLETADTPGDLTNKRGSYSETLSWRETFQGDPGEVSGENGVTFDRPIQARQVRLTVEKRHGDDHVHLHGLRLYSRIPFEK